MNDLNNSASKEDAIKSILLINKKIQFIFGVSIFFITPVVVLALTITDFDKLKFLIYFTDKAIPVIITLFGFTLAVFTFTMHIIPENMFEELENELKSEIKKNKLTKFQNQIFAYYWSLMLLLFSLVFMFAINIMLVNSPNTFLNEKSWIIDIFFYITILLFIANMLLTATITKITVLYAQFRTLARILNKKNQNSENKSDNENIN